MRLTDETYLAPNEQRVCDRLFSTAAMEAQEFAFRLDDAVDPTGELGVVEASRTSDGAATLRVWNVEHGAYMCEHEPTHREAMHWFEQGATAEGPPCVHCAAGPYPRCAPGSERAAELRTQLWRTPVITCAVMALLAPLAAVGADGDPSKRKQPDEPEPPARDEPPAQRQRREVERILRDRTVLDQAPDILMEILLRLPARDMLAVFDARPSREMWQGMRQAIARLRSAVLAGFMLHTARQGRTELLCIAQQHRHFGMFAPVALFAACETGQLRAVRFLLGSDRADPDDGDQQRPLLAAVWNEHRNVVVALVENNVERHGGARPAELWESAFGLAASRGNLAMVEYLLENAVAYGFDKITHKRDAAGNVPAWKTVQRMVMNAGSRGHALVTRVLAERLVGVSEATDVSMAEVFDHVASAPVAGCLRPGIPEFFPSSLPLEPVLRLASGAGVEAQAKGKFSVHLNRAVRFSQPVTLMLILESGLGDPNFFDFDPAARTAQFPNPFAVRFPALMFALGRVREREQRESPLSVSYDLTLVALLLADGRSDRLARELLPLSSTGLVVTGTALEMMKEWLGV
ncbi:hypothetical protein LCGC14_1843830 [marine sediment metagenome]|uniref:Uncharacterized protein n=1 Tax=marine sediment metagenome TaxID=412755 RepID=A0A0F9JBP6_9ZZZZ